MTIHPGMKFTFTKGQAKGRRGTIIEVAGNEVLVKTSRSQYWCNRRNLESRIRWQ